MSVALLDVNVLIALTWPTHVHHQIARRWFFNHRAKGWATCPLTQCGFIRISSNPRILQDAVEPNEAISVLKRLMNSDHHVFWADDISVSEESVLSNLLVGHRQVTDAYLLGLAIHHKGRLVTLDRSVAALIPKSSANANALEILRADDI